MQQAGWIAALALVAGTPGAVNAQSFSGPLSPGAFETTLNIGPVANTLREQAQRPPERAAPPAQSASFRYVPSKARRQAYLDGFVARAKRQDPAGGASLEALFAQGDVIERIGGELRAFGVRIDDVADVYTVWSISLWQASEGDTSTPTRPQVAAVRRQTAAALAKTALLNGANDAVKQELAESLLLQTALLDAGVQQAKGDPAKLREVQAAAKANAQAAGLDVTTMKLTETGFVAR